jgi:hypothetical protein
MIGAGEGLPYALKYQHLIRVHGPLFSPPQPLITLTDLIIRKTAERIFYMLATARPGVLLAAVTGNA